MPNHPGAGGLVITEIHLPARQLDETLRVDDGEWFELYNPSGTETFDLAGCAISLGDGTASRVIAETLEVAPGEYAILGVDEEIGTVLTDYVYGGALGLGVDGESLQLSCPGADGSVVVDAVDWSAEPFPTEDVTIRLDPDRFTADGNDARGGWCMGDPDARMDNEPCPVWTVTRCRGMTPDPWYADQARTAAILFVEVPGLTDQTTSGIPANDVDSRFLAQFGYGPAGTDADTSTGWTWIDMEPYELWGGEPDDPFFEPFATFDQYRPEPVLVPGDVGDQFGWTVRVSGDGGTSWMHCAGDGIGYDDLRPNYDPAAGGYRVVEEWIEPTFRAAR